MVNLIVGNDGSDTLQGSAGADLIYGYDPNGPQSQASSITATRVATGLSQALFAGAPPGDLSHLFIVQKTGQIKILDFSSGNVLSTPFLDVSSEVGTDGERGLLGLAFDPDFANNGFVYINLSTLNGNTEIRRYHVDPSNPNVVDPASATTILTIDQCRRERARAPQAPNHLRGGKRQHHQRPRRSVHCMVLEQHPKRPKQVAVGTAVGNVEPKHDVVVGVECPRCLRNAAGSVAKLRPMKV